MGRKIQKVCELCDAAYETSTTYSKRFCSKECSYKFKGETYKPVCSKCGRDKTAYSRSRGRRYICKRCNKTHTVESAKRVYGSVRNRSLVERYGITESTFDLVKEAQKGTCKLCQTNDARIVDHCHRTNRNRGLLCSRCNNLIAIFDTEPAFLAKALAYSSSSTLEDVLPESVRSSLALPKAQKAFTADEYQEIQELYRSGKAKQPQLAKLYNTSTSHISRILRGEVQRANK